MYLFVSLTQEQTKSNTVREHKNRLFLQTVRELLYLIQQEIMTIPETDQTAEGSSKNIPSWIKNNAEVFISDSGNLNLWSIHVWDQHNNIIIHSGWLIINQLVIL